MKSKFMVWIAPVALAGALALPAVAQSQDQSAPPPSSGATQASDTEQTQPAAPAKKHTATPGINQRQRNQQARIKQGVNSGQLTKGETRHLENKEAKIQTDKLEAKSDGKVTPAERAKLQHEENRTSKQIYRDKHNARTAKPRPQAKPQAQTQPTSQPQQ